MTQERQFKVGDKVILGKHQADPNGKYGTDWNPHMDQYVGKIAVITHVRADYACLGAGTYYTVDLDGGYHFWRGISMTPVSTATGAVSTDGYGAKCIKCQEYNEFVPASNSFTCWGCRN